MAPQSDCPYADTLDAVLQVILPIFALAVALLMVSRIPYPHLVNQFVRGQRSFNHLVTVVFALVVVMLVRGYSLPILCSAFVFSGPIRYLWQRVHQRRSTEEPQF